MAHATVVLGIVAVLLAALFVRLGVWQLHRLADRRAFNAEVRRALARPAVSLTRPALEAPDAGRSLRWRRVEARGRYDPAREVVVRGRSREGQPGVDLLTPLALDGGGVVWVDRGWVPSPDASRVDRALYREAGAVAVRGFLRPPERGEDLPRSLAPLLLQQLPGPALPRLPMRRGIPELSDGPHLSYAIQWFAFAGIALAGFGAYARSRRARA